MTSERELMDEIARLKAELVDQSIALAEFNSSKPLQDLMTINNTLTAENERLSARVARLEEALKPFAVIGAAISESAGVPQYNPFAIWPDDLNLQVGSRAGVLPKLIAGDFRTARRVLEEGK